MPNCCAYNCNSKRVKAGTVPAESGGFKLTFHKFPFSKPKLVKRWVRETRLKNFQPKKQHVLCSAHFEEKHFDRTGQTTRLREGAIPTIFDFPVPPKKGPRRSLYKRPKIEPIEDASVDQEPIVILDSENATLDQVNAITDQASFTLDSSNQLIFNFDGQTSGTIDILSAAAAVIDAVDTDIYIDLSNCLPPGASVPSLAPLELPAANPPAPPVLPVTFTQAKTAKVAPVTKMIRRRRGRPSTSLSSARMKSAVIPPFLKTAGTQTEYLQQSLAFAVGTQTQLPTSDSPPPAVVASMHDHCSLIQGEQGYQEGIAKMQRKLQHEKDKNFQVRKKLRMSQQKIRRLNKRIGLLKGKVHHLKQEKLATSNADGLLNQALSGLPLAMVSRIISNREYKQNKKSFTPEIRNFAVKLHACSPKAYGLVRETFERVLPHPSVVRAWCCGHVDGMPGFSKEEVQALEAIEMSFEGEQELQEGQMVNVLEIEPNCENQMAADLLTHAFFVDIAGETTEYNIVTVAAEELV